MRCVPCATVSCVSRNHPRQSGGVSGLIQLKVLSQVLIHHHIPYSGSSRCFFFTYAHSGCSHQKCVHTSQANFQVSNESDPSTIQSPNCLVLSLRVHPPAMTYVILPRLRCPTCRHETCIVLPNEGEGDQ